MPDERGHTILIGGRVVKLPVESVLHLTALIGALFVAVSVATVMMSDWQMFALYWYAPAAGGPVDPVFGHPLTFYLFTLPAWQSLSGWLLVMALLSFAIAGFFLLISGGSRALEGYANRYDLVSWRGLSIAFSFLLLVIAWRVYLGRFDLLTRGPHHLRRRHLHRRARYIHRPAHRRPVADAGRGDCRWPMPSGSRAAAG